MKKVHLLIVIPLLLSISIAATFYVTDGEVGPNGAYTFRVSERKDGAVEVKIHLLPLLGSIALQNYESANVARVRALLARDSEPVEVQVTLRHPLGADEARMFVDSVGLKVTSFLLVGKGSNGEKATTIINSDLSEVPDSETGPRDQSIKYLGVMVLQGTIAPTAKDLGQLAADDRVYLADTTLNEVRSLVRRDPRWSSKVIESVSAPSPFWDLAWGQQP